MNKQPPSSVAFEDLFNEQEPQAKQPPASSGGTVAFEDLFAPDTAATSDPVQQAAQQPPPGATAEERFANAQSIAAPAQAPRQPSPPQAAQQPPPQQTQYELPPEDFVDPTFQEISTKAAKVAGGASEEYQNYVLNLAETGHVNADHTFLASFEPDGMNVDPKWSKVTQDFEKYVAENGGSVPELQFSMQEMEERKAKGGWDQDKQTAYNLAMLSHQDQILKGRMLRLEKLVSAGGVSPEVVQAELADINAGRQFVDSKSRELFQANQQSMKNQMLDRLKQEAKRKQQAGEIGWGKATMQQAVAGFGRASYNTASTVAKLVDFLEPFDTGKYTWSERFFDYATDQLNAREAKIPEQYTGQFIEQNDKGKYVISKPQAIVPQVAGTLAQMIPFVASGAAGTPGVVTMGFAQEHEEFVRQGLEAGVNPDVLEAGAIPYGVMAGLTEVINPQTYLAKRTARQEVLRQLKKGVEPNMAVRMGMGFAREGVQETAEELMQGVEENVTQRLLNYYTGKESFDTEVDGAEVAQTVTLAFIAGGLMGGMASARGKGGKPSSMFLSAMDAGMQDFAGTMEGIKNAPPEVIPDDQKETVAQQFEAYAQAHAGMPDTMTPEQKWEVAQLILEKKAIQQKQKDAPVDEAVAAVAEDPRNAEIAAIDEKIKQKVAEATSTKVPTDEETTQEDTPQGEAGGEVQPQEQPADVQSEQPQTATQEPVYDAGTTDAEPVAEQGDQAGGETAQEATAQTQEEANAAEAGAVDGTEDAGGVDQGQEEALTEQPAQQEEQTPEQRRVESGGFIVSEDAEGNLVVEQSPDFKEPKVKASKHRKVDAARRNAIRTRRTKAIREFDEKYGTSYAPSTNAIKEQRKRQQAVSAKMEEQGKLSVDDIALKMIGVEGVRVSSESVRKEMYPDLAGGKLSSEHLNLRRLKIAVDKQKATKDKPVYSIEALAEKMVESYQDEIGATPDQTEDRGTPFDIQEARQAIIDALNIGSRSKALEELESRFGLTGSDAMSEMEKMANAAGVDIETVLDYADQLAAEERRAEDLAQAQAMWAAMTDEQKQQLINEAEEGRTATADEEAMDAGTRGPGPDAPGREDRGGTSSESDQGVDEEIPPFSRESTPQEQGRVTAAVQAVIDRVKQAFPGVDVVTDQEAFDEALAEAGQDAQFQMDPDRAKLTAEVQSAQRALDKATKDFNNRALDLFAADQQTELDTGADSSQENFDRITAPLRAAVEQAKKKLADYDRNKGVADSQQGVLFSTAGGNVMGFFRQGRVYLNPSAVRPDTPIHEAGHLWTTIARITNPAVYNAGITLAKKSPYFEQVQADPAYAGLTEEQQADEALARAIADKGVQFMEQPKWKQWWNRFWQAVKRGAAAIGLDFTGINPDTTTFGEFVEKVAGDILSGRPVTSVTSEQLEKAVNEGYTEAVNIAATVLPRTALASKPENVAMMWWRQNMRKDQGAPTVVRDVNKMKGRLAAAAKRVAMMQMDLNQAINEATNDAATKAEREMMATRMATTVHEYANGKADISDLPKEVGVAAEAFRKAIEVLGKQMVDELGMTPGFDAGISETLQFYLRERSTEADHQTKYETAQAKALAERLEQVAKMKRDALVKLSDSNDGRLQAARRRALARKKVDLEHQLKAMEYSDAISMAPAFRKKLQELERLIAKGGGVGTTKRAQDEAAKLLAKEIQKLQEEVDALAQAQRTLTEEEVDLLAEIEEATAILSEMEARAVEDLSDSELMAHVQRQEQRLHAMDKAVRRAEHLDMAPKYVQWATDPKTGDSTLTVFHNNGSETVFHGVTPAQKKQLFGQATADQMIAEEEGTYTHKEAKLLTGNRLYQSMMANMGTYVTRAYRAFYDPDNWPRTYRQVIGDAGMAEVKDHVVKRLRTQRVAGYVILPTSTGNAVKFINAAGYENRSPYTAEKVERHLRGSGQFSDELLDTIVAKMKAGETGRVMLPSPTKPVSDRLVNFAPSVTEAEVEQFIDDVVTQDGARKMMQGTPIGKVETGIFMRKKDVDEPIRALLGEITNGRESLPMTLFRMSTAFAQREAAMRIVTDGMGTSFSEREDKFHPVKLTHEDLPFLSQDTVVYATQSAANVLKPYMRSTKGVNGFITMLYALSTMAKVNVTVLRSTSQARNFNSMPWQVWMTGGFPLNVGRLAYSTAVLSQAMDRTSSRVGAVFNLPLGIFQLALGQRWGHRGRGGDGKWNKQYMRDLYNRFVELEGGQQGANIGLLNDLVKKSEPLLNKWAPGRLYKKFIKQVTPAYAMSDEIPKFWVWLNEMDTLRKAHPEWSKAQVEAEAMSLTLKNTWTYSNNPNLIQNLSVVPVAGAFVNWRWATWAAVINNVAQARKEIASKNKTIKTRGYKRAAGVLTSIMAVEGAAALAAMMFGWDDDDMDALVENLPEYEQNNQRIMLSADKKQPSFLDLTYMVPQSQYYMPINVFTRSQRRGSSTGEAAWNVMVDEFQNYAGAEVWLNAALEGYKAAEKTGDWKDGLTPLGQVMVPGIVGDFANLGRAAQGERRLMGGEVIGEYNLAEEAFNLVVGTKARNRDPMAVGLRRTSRAAQLMNRERSKYLKWEDEYKRFEEDPEREAALQKEYYEANMEKWKEHYQSAKASIDGLLQLGFTEQEIRAEGKEMGVAEWMMNSLLKGDDVYMGWEGKGMDAHKFSPPPFLETQPRE